MNGTTKATESCMFLTTLETQELIFGGRKTFHNQDMAKAYVLDENEEFKADEEALKKAQQDVTEESKKDRVSSFWKVQKVVTRMKSRGFFAKPWIIIPINIHRYHWVFLALLNVSYLGSAQDKKFTAAFYYDSFKMRISHEDVMEILNQYGILNLIVYTNLVYGRPAMTGEDIRKKLFDPEYFPIIQVPLADFVEQIDGFNCGIFVWLCMMEMSLVHSRKYHQQSDFVQETEDDGVTTYLLQKGDWFKLFKKPTKLKGDVSGEDLVVTSLPSIFFDSVREQALVLFNRILVLKTKNNMEPRRPSASNVLPAYIQTNIRKYVWEIDDNNMESIKVLRNWLRGDNTAEMNKLLVCENPAITAPEMIYLDGTSEDDDLSKEKIPSFTIQELLDAGMEEVIDDDDDEEVVAFNDNNLSSKKRKESPVAFEGSPPDPKRSKTDSTVDDKENKEGQQNLMIAFESESNILSGGEGTSNLDTQMMDVTPLQESLGEQEKSVTFLLTDHSGDEQKDGGLAVATEDVANLGGKVDLLGLKDPPISAPQEVQRLKAPPESTPPLQMNPLEDSPATTQQGGQPLTRKTPPRHAKALPTHYNRISQGKKLPTQSEVARKPAAKEPTTTKYEKNVQAGNALKPVPVPDESLVWSEKKIKDTFGGKRQKQDFPASQQTLKEAYVAIAKMAGMPSSDKEFNEWKTTRWKQKKNETATQYKKRIAAKKAEWENFKRNNKNEATLHKFNSVKALQYVPENMANARKGSFRVLLTGTEDTLEVERDWVMNNFESEVVHSVVFDRIGHFVPLPDDHVAVKIPMDNRQVQKLRWIVPEKVDDKEPECHFQGILMDETATDLTDDFVKKNFSTEFIEIVKSEGEKHKLKFFHVPPGAPRTTEDHSMMDESLPQAKYMQLGEPTCLFSSCASALHYIGFHDIAKYVQDMAPHYSSASVGAVRSWEGLVKVMEKTCNFLVPQKIYGSFFKILTDVSEYPTVVSLEDMEGGTHHAVTIVGRLIFDSNCPRALPLTRRSLDYCCSTTTVDGKFKRVHRGFRFEEDKKKKKKILDKKKKKYGINFYLDAQFSDDDEEIDEVE